eukprot:TRINITY_DN1666_c0_g1_i4.p1 TRINITY_DN1666_c0_g1~~TRINITY_DN1666_c0_g1_i4.p1  ORF type:complete len:466 (+),score=94.97 TRINITY_DN1666_c0_g1_i4:112-1509(+)
MKRISVNAWKFFVTQYGGGPELDSHSFCESCARDWLTQKRASLEFKEKRDEVMQQIRYGNCGEYAVSEKFIEELKHAKYSSKLNNGTLLDPVMCSHGGLALTAKFRNVSTEVWEYFCQQCEGVPPRPLHARLPCAECRRLQCEVANQEQQEKYSKQTEKYNNIFVSAVSNLVPETCYAIVSFTWLRKWRRYLDDDGEHPGKIDNSDLLCEHGLLLYEVTEQLSSWSHSKGTLPLELLPEQLYVRLAERYSEACTVSPRYAFVADNNLRWREFLPALVEGTSTPPYCTECRGKPSAQQEARAALFLDEDVEVRRVMVPQIVSSERRVRVSHDTTVGDFKQLLYQQWLVPPTRQLLELENGSGTLLLNTTDTLGSYGVRPGCIITLTEVDGSVSDMEKDVATSSNTAAAQPTVKEIAFEHTGLADFSDYKKRDTDPPALPPTGKPCPACTFLNPPTTAKCEICGTTL